MGTFTNSFISCCNFAKLLMSFETDNTSESRLFMLLLFLLDMFYSIISIAGIIIEFIRAQVLKSKKALVESRFCVLGHFP